MNWLRKILGLKKKETYFEFQMRLRKQSNEMDQLFEDRRAEQHARREGERIFWEWVEAPVHDFGNGKKVKLEFWTYSPTIYHVHDFETAKYCSNTQQLEDIAKEHYNKLKRKWELNPDTKLFNP